MANNTEFDFDDENLGPKPLRDFAKAQAKQNEELKKALDELKTQERTRTVRDAVKTKGLPDKVADMILKANADPEEWITEYGDVFGVTQEPQGQDPQGQQTAPQAQQPMVQGVGQDSDLARQFAQFQAAAAQATPGQSPAQADPMRAALEKAGAEGGANGIANFLRANGVAG